VGHHQSFTFCSAHWVRPRDHFTCQQTPTSFSGHHTTTTPPQPPRFYTRHCRQNTGGSTEGHGDGKRAGAPGTSTICFYLFIFFMVFLYQHNPSCPGVCPIHLTMPCPAAGHEKCAICSTFFVFGSYSLMGILPPHSHQHPLPISPPLSTCQTRKTHHLWHIFHVRRLFLIQTWKCAICDMFFVLSGCSSPPFPLP